MKRQPGAIVLGISIGMAIQVQCFCAPVLAAEQEPGVPVQSNGVDSGTVDPTNSAPSGASVSAGSETTASTSQEPIQSIPADPGQIVDSESPLTSEPKSPDVISPVVLPTNLVDNYRQVPMQGRVQQVDSIVKPPVEPEPESMDSERESKDPERESKGTLRGKIGKSLLKGGTNKSVPAAERPWWIPGNAFTDDSMVAPYHNLDIAWWDKRPMPNRPQWVRLSKSVTRYWKGSVSEPCFVLITPMDQVPGNFTFRSRSPFGPRGWLQALNVPDRKGFPQYRYWLDQP